MRLALYLKKHFTVLLALFLLSLFITYLLLSFYVFVLIYISFFNFFDFSVLSCFVSSSDCNVFTWSFYFFICGFTFCFFIDQYRPVNFYWLYDPVFFPLSYSIFCCSSRTMCFPNAPSIAILNSVMKFYIFYNNYIHIRTF